MRKRQRARQTNARAKLKARMDFGRAARMRSAPLNQIHPAQVFAEWLRYYYILQCTKTKLYRTQDAHASGAEISPWQTHALIS